MSGERGWASEEQAGLNLSGGGHMESCPGRERVEFSSKVKAEKQAGTAFLGKQMSLSQHQTVTRVELKGPPGRPHSPSRGSLQLPGNLCCWCFYGIQVIPNCASWHDQRQGVLETFAQTFLGSFTIITGTKAGQYHAILRGSYPFIDG